MEIKRATVATFRRITIGQLQPILDVLVGIKWPCPAGQVPSILEQLGWMFISERVDIDADTRLPFNYTVGEFSIPDGQFRRLGFPLSDRVSKTDSAAMQLVRDQFPLAVRDMESILGPWSHEDEDGLPGVAWDLESGGRIRLDCIGSGLQGRLLSQALAETERYMETHDMSEFYEDE